MATHASILALPGESHGEELDEPQSMGSESDTTEQLTQ